MELILEQDARRELGLAEEMNPGPWVDHSKYVSLACGHIAAALARAGKTGMDPDQARLYGLLHDIGRRVGRCSERHLLEGYRHCEGLGWHRAAGICITHAFMVQDIETSIGAFDMPEEDKAFMAAFVKNAAYDDYDRLVQLCDSLALPTGFCLLEKRFVDVTLRYGMHPHTVGRWKAVLAIKEDFEARLGHSIYTLLPGVAENSIT